ncbi:RWD domain-containing protein 4-like [Diadema antillarum]|uniref:RWD domain-containing protein 4-like n=1 Tax=Diadema antillarum TaxID=105358 RepID=UPI003A8B5209
MTTTEEQEEEREVLLSIYDGDDCFKALDEKTYQYKIGDAGDNKSFLLEISWGEDYPSSCPKISLDAFFNNHISQHIKDNIISRIGKEAEQWLDSAMTFTLFEFAKENAEEFMSAQEEASPIDTEGEKDEKEDVVQSTQQTAKPKEKKEQLTKAQKRKLADRTNYKGERPRGWDWVDVIKHLSKTGPSKPDS